MSKIKEIADSLRDLGLSSQDQTVGTGNPITVALSKFMDKLIFDIKDNLAQKGSNVSMTLSQSISKEPIKVEAANISVALVMEDYAKFRDKGVSGTGIGLKDGDTMRETSSKFKFKNNRPSMKHIMGDGDGLGLRDWVNAKGGDMSLAYAIGTNNKKLGIKGNKFYSEITTPARWARLARAVEKAIANKLNGNNGN